MKKKRLDQILQEILPQLSRTQIANMIKSGLVTINKKIITKPGFQMNGEEEVEFKLQESKYVSRAGYKLEKALTYFSINVKDLVALDSGLSTGGFTDCLLQFGAKKVYGVDVGHGQTHEKIQRDPRVVIIEKTNLRDLRQLPEKVDLVTLDLSFISVLKVIANIIDLMKENAKLIVLIKPQFEAKKEQIGKGGIIKNVKIHKEVINNVVKGIKNYGFEIIGVIESPIIGSSGNKEFLVYFVRK